jgi:Retron-type reverse transcriptase
MRNPIHVLKYLEEKATCKNYKYERLYRNLYNPEFYLIAYQNIAKSQGSMTPGTDGITLKGMSLERINKIIVKLKDHSYQPNPVRRTYISKKNSKNKRPLGIPSTDDKLIQEVIRMILEAIYEPTFSDNSHGFRPKRSCHTALIQTQHLFKGTKWIVEGDIKACFDSFDHHVLIDLLRKRINDECFINLMWKFLKAGYMEQWEYHKTYSGTPQGSGMSPILSNIYLSEIDLFMEEYKKSFDLGVTGKRKVTSEYNSVQNRYFRLLTQYRESKSTLNADELKILLKEIKQLQKKRLMLPYNLNIDPNFKRIQYNRYADDFIIGINGSKADAEKVKEDIKVFLRENLKLILSEEKTKITHSAERCRYLGYDISISRSKAYKRLENGVLRRTLYGAVQLLVPSEKWISKLREYKTYKVIKGENGKEWWKVLHRGSLLNKKDVEIVSKFNSEIRGIYNYYRLAYNASSLNNFYYIMKRSLQKTFASKYSTTVSKIRNKYEKDGVFCVQYSTNSGLKTCEFYHEGFARKSEIALEWIDNLPQYKKYDKPNTLGNRLKQKTCELCGSRCNEIKMYHVRTLKELSDTKPWEIKMKAIRRKSLATCTNCFETIQNSK